MNPYPNLLTLKNDLTITLAYLKNDQHFQLFTEFKAIAVEYDPEELKIKPQFDDFCIHFQIEDDVMKKIRKSALTAKIKVADSRRNDIFIGLSEICRVTAGRHFDSAVKSAATDLLIVFDAYGRLTRKPLSEKTSAISNLVNELHDNHKDDVETVGLESWVIALHDSNNTCNQLIQNRWIEDAAKIKTGMKEARAAVDASYAAIMRRILALQEVEGGEIYESFLRRLGAVIDSYNTAIAQRQGRLGKEGADDITDEPDAQL